MYLLEYYNMVWLANMDLDPNNSFIHGFCCYMLECAFLTMTWYLFLFYFAGTKVAEVVVRDYDAGQNALTDLTLLQQGPGNNFRFNPVTGAIETIHSLDREAEDTYHIVMQAVDRGTSPQTGTGTLTITVLDVNDNPPYFTQTYEVCVIVIMS